MQDRNLQQVINDLIIQGCNPDAAVRLAREAFKMGASPSERALKRRARNAKYYAAKKRRQQEEPELLLDLEPAPRPAPAPKKKKRKPSEMDEGWTPDERNINYALGMGFDASRIAREAEEFRDYWLRRTKNDQCKDWSAAWRTWVRKARDFDAKRNAKPNGGGFIGATMSILQEGTYATASDTDIEPTDIEPSFFDLNLDRDEYTIN